MHNHDMPVPPSRPSVRREPDVVIHVRGWHLQIDNLPRLPLWLLIWAAPLAGSAVGAWDLFAR